MDAKELMIGDIVNIKCLNIEDEEVFLPGKIVSVGEDFVSATAIDDTYQFECPEIFEGVPLTAEILEKNRFENMHGNRFVYREYKLEISIEKYEDDDIILSIGHTHHGRYDNIHVCINYIHELQHALRLFGLCNIANNFKIEAK